jgi:cytochrome b pre-mRNA-processing protein 3
VVFKRLFKRNPCEESARALYGAIVAQAREPAFYGGLDVPDSLDGRFELIALHGFLVLHRLKRDGENTADLAQSLFDVLFQDMDASLREMGAGDLGVGRRVKTMVKGFYGAGLARGLVDRPEALSAALRRNLYGTVEPGAGALSAMAGYVAREAAALARQDTEALAVGAVVFGPPPGPGEGL